MATCRYLEILYTVGILSSLSPSIFLLTRYPWRRKSSFRIRWGITVCREELSILLLTYGLIEIVGSLEQPLLIHVLSLQFIHCVPIKGNNHHNLNMVTTGFADMCNFKMIDLSIINVLFISQHTQCLTVLGRDWTILFAWLISRWIIGRKRFTLRTFGIAIFTMK